MGRSRPQPAIAPRVVSRYGRNRVVRSRVYCRLMLAPPRAVSSLRGLALGDAFGDQYFLRDGADQAVAERWLAPEPWRWTDDTAMALSIFEVLLEYGEVQPDALATSFAARYDPARGYGPSMHRVLGALQDGQHWSAVAAEQFGGQGSHGNGAAMRVAPVGAWFAIEGLEVVAEQARVSARVTHAHPEAIAGAVAVAVAAAVISLGAEGAGALEAARAATAGTDVGGGLARARRLPTGTSIPHAVTVLGNGTGLSAVDTVPFALWSASLTPEDYEVTMWRTVSALGDRDTTCAIAGGVVGAVLTAALPSDWLELQEPLPAWVTA